MPASCCRGDARKGTDAFFTRSSRSYLRKFASKGLRKEQRALADGIAAIALSGRSILEIGCGVGGLHLTLLERGGAQATGVDISEGMILAARSLAEARGLAPRATHIHGDFVEMRHQVPRADIVILDKVVCCYRDLDILLDASLEHSGLVYAISYPRPRRLNRAGFALLAALTGILGWSFTPQWHDWTRMLERIAAAGFVERTRSQSFVWAVRVFERQ